MQSIIKYIVEVNTNLCLFFLIAIILLFIITTAIGQIMLDKKLERIENNQKIYISYQEDGVNNEEKYKRTSEDK